MSWPIQEIFEASIAVTVFIVLTGIIFYAFDENTIETTLVGSEMSYVSTIFPNENAQVSYQLHEEARVNSQNNQIIVEIDKARTEREFFSQNPPSISQEGRILRITS